MKVIRLFLFVCLSVTIITNLSHHRSIVSAQSTFPFWTEVASPPSGIKVMFNDGSTLFAGTEGSGVYRTDDDGRTWVPSNTGIENARVRSFVAVGANWYVGADAGVYRSNDKGKSWVAVNNGLTYMVGSSVKTRSALALAFNGTSLFAGADKVDDATNAPAIYRSTDLGQNWVEVRNGLPAVDNCSSLAVAGANVFALINGSIYRSTDNGQSWAPINISSVFSMVAIRQSVFAARSDGLWRSDDLGQVWTQVRRPPKGITGDGTLTGLTSSGTNLFITEKIPASPSAIYYNVSFSADLGGTWLYTANPQRIGPFPPPVGPVVAASDSLFVGLPQGAPNGIQVHLYVRKGFSSPGMAVLSAASYGNLIASDSLASAFGLDFSTTTEVATTIPLPTELAGISVKVRDRDGAERIAPLLFVSPKQINFHVPPGTAKGTAQITITSNGNAIRVGSVEVGAVAPALFTANMSGAGVPAALALRVKADGSSQYESIMQFDSAQNQFVPKPIDLGAETDRVYLILFGTGVRNHSGLENIEAVFSRGPTIRPDYAGAQGEFVGLDQINVSLTRSLAGSGELDLHLSIKSEPISNIVTVNFK
ncbi:MAG: hypothetical protein HONDAALG_02925 [Gammaproteobacteria bacterium]|nr:hypothetical protein [Gammaproteobacteria bacterium]